MPKRRGESWGQGGHIEGGRGGRFTRGREHREKNNTKQMKWRKAFCVCGWNQPSFSNNSRGSMEKKKGKTHGTDLWKSPFYSFFFGLRFSSPSTVFYRLFPPLMSLALSLEWRVSIKPSSADLHTAQCCSGTCRCSHICSTSKSHARCEC